MKRVLTAAVLIPIVVLVLFKAPLWLFTLFVFGVAVLAAHEYFGIVKAQGFQPFDVLSYLFLAISFVAIYVMSQSMFTQPNDAVARLTQTGAFVLCLFGLPAVALLGPLIFLLLGLRREPLSRALPDAAVSYLVLPYVGFTLGLLPLLGSARNGAMYLLYVMLLVWAGDIAAYYVGRAIGKHKLAPRVSPGKSWEGAIASALSAILVGIVLLRYIEPTANGLRKVHLLSQNLSSQPDPGHPPLWLVALFAVVVNIAAQFGDLVESALKRGAGVKDSGTLVPGHGGVLDRVDAILFALPVGLIFYLTGLSRYFDVA